MGVKKIIELVFLPSQISYMTITTKIQLLHDIKVLDAVAVEAQ